MTNQATSGQAYLTFALGQDLYALPIQDVRTIIRREGIIPVPQASAKWEGVLNFHGSLLTVWNGSTLMGYEQERPEGDAKGKIIVVAQRQQYMGISVDHVTSVVHVEPEEVTLLEGNGSFCGGYITHGESGRIIRLLLGSNIRELLELTKERQEGAVSGGAAVHARHTGAEGYAVFPVQEEQESHDEEKNRQFVRFQVEGETYAVPLDCVAEIMPCPERIDRLVGAPDALIGVGLFREMSLPILDSSMLLLGCRMKRSPSCKVIRIQCSAGERSLDVGIAVNQVQDICSLRGMSRLSSKADRLGHHFPVIQDMYYSETAQHMFYALDLDAALQQNDLLAFMDAGGKLRTEKQQQWAEESAAADEADDGFYLLVQTGGQSLGLPLASVKEIVKLRAVEPVPFAPGFVKGIANIRGQLIPVVDLGKRLNGSCDDRKLQRIVVTEHAGRTVGLAVQHATHVKRVRRSEIGSTSGFLHGWEDTKWFQGIMNNEAAMIPILCMEPLVTWN